jgi:hypothetical protein
MTHPADDRPKSPPAPSSKSSVVAIGIAAVLGGFVAFVVNQIQLTIELDRRQEPVASPFPKTSATASPQSTGLPKTEPAAAIADGLRVSNQTRYPLRLVLLQSATLNLNPKSAKPTHWDFAPNEGSQNGLLLSLPKENLRLSRGDILMAFALDGSRRYWGPYIVDETPLPTQSKASGIWQLVIKPEG